MYGRHLPVAHYTGQAELAEASQDARSAKTVRVNKDHA